MKIFSKINILKALNQKIIGKEIEEVMRLLDKFEIKFGVIDGMYHTAHPDSELLLKVEEVNYDGEDDEPADFVTKVYFDISML